MKKIIFVFVSAMLFLSSMYMEGNASYIPLPDGAIEYSSLNAVPKPTNNRFGNYSLVQNYELYEKTSATDYYLRVYVAEKTASLPVQRLTPALQMTTAGRINYEYVEEESANITYEESISSIINTSIGSEIKSACGVPLNYVTTTISASMSSTLKTEIKKTTELKLVKGTKFSFSMDVGPGFYFGERRAIYKYYIIQKAGIVYNMVKDKKGNFVRGTEKKYALFETIGQFVCLGEGSSVLGIYEYERMPNGIDFRIVTTNLTDANYVVYL